MVELGVFHWSILLYLTLFYCGLTCYFMALANYFCFRVKLFVFYIVALPMPVLLFCRELSKISGSLVVYVGIGTYCSLFSDGIAGGIV